MRIFLSILAVILISTSSLSAQPKFNFKVKTDKLELKFQEVSGLDLESSTVKPKEGSASTPTTPRKLPGIKKSSNVVCKKGMASNTKEMNDFLTSTKQGSITIELLDEQGKTANSWVLSNAYISKTVKVADGNSLVIESLDIIYQGITAVNKK